MKNLKNQNLIHNQNYSLYPNGAIKNETDTEEGTPVVNEVYNDLLMNVYALIRNRKVGFNNLEDNEENGYQLITALGRVFNDYTDSYKILTQVSDGFSIDLDLSIAPDKAIFYVRFSDAPRVFADSNGFIYDNSGIQVKFTAKTTIKSGDDAILIYDGNLTRAYSLNPLSLKESNIDSLVTFGNPLQQNEDITKLWYYKDGVLSNMQLEFYDIENKIKEQNESFILKNVVQIQNYFLCLVSNPETSQISIWYFKDGNFIVPVQATVQGIILSDDNVDYDPYLYVDGNKVFITNQAGNSDNPNLISQFVFDTTTGVLQYSFDLTVGSSFVKSDNVVARPTYLMSINSLGIVKSFFNGNDEVNPSYNQIVGHLFTARNYIYFTDGHNAVRIP